MPRRPVQRLGRTDLAQLAQVHHRHPVADLLDQREVVRDEQVAQPELGAQLLQQVEHLGLDQHVERGDRLVAHDQRRVQRDRPGDRHPLALAAGQLARAPPPVHVGVETHQVEQLPHAPAPAAGVAVAVPDQRFLDDVGDAPARVERAVRVLEHHLHVPPGAFQPAPPQAHQFGALEPHRAGLGSRGLHHAPGQRRLARAGLPHDAEGLPGIEVERDVGDGVDDRRP